MLAFCILVACSLVLTATTNRVFGNILEFFAPSQGWIATAAVPSMILILILYMMFGSRKPLHWPMLDRATWRRVFALSAVWLFLWLIGSLIAAIIAGHWINYAAGLPLVAAFIIFGPIGEELLFRGLIFEKARDLWPTSANPAIFISTLSFSFHHVALDAAPHGLGVTQILFTIPLGLVLASIRERTGSIWPGCVLHIVTNIPALF